MLWFGLILLVIGVVLFFLSRRSADKAHYIKATDTSRIGDIQSLVAEIAADMPGMGTGYTDYVELKGTIVCDEPIRGELCDELVAVCATKVERVVERREEKRDPQGNVRTEWRKHTDTVSQNRREAPFFIEDASGRIKVKPHKAVPELVKVVDRFEPANTIEQFSGDNLVLNLGSFRLAVGGGRTLGSHSRTIGYKFTESVLPLGKAVYALGEVADLEDEGLVLRKPTDDHKKRPFMVSVKTESELVDKTERSSKIMRIIGFVLMGAGVALAVVGVVT